MEPDQVPWLTGDLMIDMYQLGFTLVVGAGLNWPQCHKHIHQKYHKRGEIFLYYFMFNSSRPPTAIRIQKFSSHCGLSPVQCQANIWTYYDGSLLTGPVETNFSEIWITIQNFSLKYVFCQPNCLNAFNFQRKHCYSAKLTTIPTSTHWGWVTHICICKIITG